MDSGVRATGPLGPDRLRVAATHLSLVLMVSLASGCYRTYLSPDFGSYQERHRTIALLPFHVVDAGDHGKTVYHQLLYAELLERQVSGRYTVQVQDVEETDRLVWESLLQMEDVLRLQGGGVARGSIIEHTPGGSLKIQAPDGEVLEYTEDEIAWIAREPAGEGREQAGAAVDSTDIAQRLGVDAVLHGRVTLPNPLHPVAELLCGIVGEALGGSSGTGEYAEVHMTIADGVSGELLWEYERKLEVNMLLPPDAAAKRLIGWAAGSFPYERPR